MAAATAGALRLAQAHYTHALQTDSAEGQACRALLTRANEEQVNYGDAPPLQLTLRECLKPRGGGGGVINHNIKNN